MWGYGLLMPGLLGTPEHGLSITGATAGAAGGTATGGTGAFAASSNGGQRTATGSSGAEPMDVDAMANLVAAKLGKLVGQQPKPFRGKCFKCLKVGHRQQDCPEK